MASRKVWEGVKEILPVKDFSQNLRIGKAARICRKRSRYYPKITGLQTTVSISKDIPIESITHKKMLTHFCQRGIINLTFVPTLYVCHVLPRRCYIVVGYKQQSNLGKYMHSLFHPFISLHQYFCVKRFNVQSAVQGVVCGTCTPQPHPLLG